MFMEHLALTYKCHSSIGNSLDLHNMIKEVLTTFVEETNAISGFFYLVDENNKLYVSNIDTVDYLGIYNSAKN